MREGDSLRLMSNGKLLQCWISTWADCWLERRYAPERGDARRRMSEGIPGFSKRGRQSERGDKLRQMTKEKLHGIPHTYSLTKTLHSLTGSSRMYQALHWGFLCWHIFKPMYIFTLQMLWSHGDWHTLPSGGSCPIPGTDFIQARHLMIIIQLVIN